MIGALLTLAPQRNGDSGLNALSRFNLPSLVLFSAAMVCILLLLLVFKDRADLEAPVTEETVAFSTVNVTYTPLHSHSHGTDGGAVRIFYCLLIVLLLVRSSCCFRMSPGGTCESGRHWERGDWYP